MDANLKFKAKNSILELILDFNPFIEIDCSISNDSSQSFTKVQKPPRGSWGRSPQFKIRGTFPLYLLIWIVFYSGYANLLI